MTDRSDFKRLVRRRMQETGESYTVARSHFTVPQNDVGAPAQASSELPTTVAAFKKKVYGRKRIKDLPAHLEQVYGFVCTGITKLDVGVYRVDRGTAPSWIARVFSSLKGIESARGDAEILSHLEQVEFPAEKVADPEPVSVLAGQPVLVTEYVPGDNRREDSSQEVMLGLGQMLGQLHSLHGGPDACTRAAGSWHHLSVNGGGRGSDIEILRMLFQDAEKQVGRADRLLLARAAEEVRQLDDLEDLPKALIHTDVCGANLIGTQGEVGTLVDWTGAGRGPRLLSFANLIATVGPLALVDEAVAGYRAHASLEARELDRLEAALLGFPFILDCWMLLFHGGPAEMLLKRLETHKQRASRIAERAREAFLKPYASRDEGARVDESQGSLF